jgi:hypothetical protein
VHATDDTVTLIGLLLGAIIFALSLSTVSPEAIQASVNRAPEMLERAWQLPVAASFKPNLTWQSNASRCGPASVANAFGSLGEPSPKKVARSRPL